MRLLRAYTRLLRQRTGHAPRPAPLQLTCSERWVWGAALPTELLDEGVVSEDEFASGLSWAVSEEYVDSSQVRLRRTATTGASIPSSCLGSLGALNSQRERAGVSLAERER
jgi:hypothetical protein